MLFIWGRTSKQQVLQQWAAPCPFCHAQTAQRLLRSYRVAHLFWFPLFSSGDTFAQACAQCGGTVAVAKPAGALPPKPLLHRFGFMFPVLGVMALVGLVGTLFVVAALAAKPDPALAARSARLDALEKHLEKPGAWGNNPEAEQLAAAVRGAFGTFKQAEDREQAAVAVDVVGTSPRRAIIVVHVPSLRHWGGRDRRRLLLQLAGIVEPKLKDDTQALIGVQGVLLFGPLAVRSKKGQWSFQTDAPNAESRLRDAYAVTDEKTKAPAAPHASATDEKTKAPAAPRASATH